MDSDILEITKLFQKLSINDHTSIKNDIVNQYNIINMFSKLNLNETVNNSYDDDDNTIYQLIDKIDNLTLTDNNIIIEMKDYSKIIYNINNCTLEYRKYNNNFIPYWTF